MSAASRASDVRRASQQLNSLRRWRRDEDHPDVLAAKRRYVLAVAASLLDEAAARIAEAEG